MEHTLQDSVCSRIQELNFSTFSSLAKVSSNWVHEELAPKTPIQVMVRTRSGVGRRDPHTLGRSGTQIQAGRRSGCRNEEIGPC